MKNTNIKYLLLYFLPVFLFGLLIGSLMSFKTVAKSDCYFDKGINLRGSIPNVREKILKGKEVKLLYFGGSITHMDGWRNKTTAWLENTFTNVTFIEFNSCISGSGSFFGVYRLEDDVINYSPDLVFIEFAVNDSIDEYYIKNFLKKNIDEIVCRIKLSKPDTDIVFVYTISKKMLFDYKNGIASSSAKEIEKIADKYNIPSIDFGYRISYLHDKGLLKFDKRENFAKEIPAFSEDGVHPLQYGHSIYFGLIKEFFNSAMTQPVTSRVQPVFEYNGKTHKLFAINTNDFSNYGFVNMKYGKDSIFSHSNIISFNWSNQFIDLDVKGSSFGILISMPDGNYSYNVSIDKGPEKLKKFYGFGSASPKIYFSEFDLPGDNKTHHLKIWKNDDNVYNLIFFLSDGDITVLN